MSTDNKLSVLQHFSEEQANFLVNTIHDWQFQHGSLLKVVRDRGFAHPIGTTLFPSRFPSESFQAACDLQPLFNKLYASIAEDEQWLYDSLQDSMRDQSSMARILWSVHRAVKDEGYIQKLSLGVFRSDYMLHENEDAKTTIKQVEFNTYSVAGGAHGKRVSDLHKYLLRTGAYTNITPAAGLLPDNTTVESIAAGLEEAHIAYGCAKSKTVSNTGVLMVVQPNNINICDERPIEESLWQRGIPCHRIEFGNPTLASIRVTDSGELLFRHGALGSGPHVEISVVYHRAGYDVEEYNDVGLETRYQLEKSRAIKCPSVLCHMATLKIVQQKLAIPGALEQFISVEEASRLRPTFTPMFPMNESELGKQGQELALSAGTAINYVLKPCLEGGGHNIYRDEIPPFLNSKSRESWGRYILMEMIKSPEAKNHLLTPNGIYSGRVISELGVFGVVLWNKEEANTEILINKTASTSLKTKPEHINEMSVVKGFGCFDSPLLI